MYGLPVISLVVLLRPRGHRGGSVCKGGEGLSCSVQRAHLDLSSTSISLSVINQRMLD